MNKFTPNATWFNEYNIHGNSTKAMRELKRSEPEFIIKYVASDGWRGYYEAKAKKGTGWKPVDVQKMELAGWVTGNWEDAPDGAAADDVESKINALYERVSAEGGEMKMIMLPTSNVFSTAYDLFIKGIELPELAK